MTQTWAIVAIPEESDAVHKVSSEKVAHMTLLFLGEQDDPEKALQITQYLQHVTNTSLNKFYLRVRDRGTLGPESADVLFFENTARHIKQISDFRSFLLADDTISECYNSTDQFPEWTPHLTLGYPGSPAKKTQGLSSLPIYSVYFDKIAFWVEDSDGPSFLLTERDYSHLDDYATPAYHSDTRADLLIRNAIARQSRLGGGERISTDARPVDYTTPIESAIVHAIPDAVLHAQRLSNQDRVIQHAATGELQLGSKAPSRTAYVRENQAALESYLEHHLDGGAKSGALSRIAIVTRPDEDWLVTRVDSISHSGTIELKIRPITDSRGVIEDYEVIHDAFTDLDVRTALMHVGVKGMKWGVRRNRPDISAAASAVRGKGGELGAAAKARAGAAKDKFGASREAKRVAKASAPKGSAGMGTDSASKKTKEERKADKQAAKSFDRKGILKKPAPSEEAEINAQARKRTEKHGTDLMSNKELQAMVTRMNLEQQYQQLMESEKPKTARAAGKAYVVDVLKNAGQELANEAVKYAATEAAKGAFNQARNSDSGTRTWVSSTSRRARSSQAQIGPGLQQILQLPPGRGRN